MIDLALSLRGITKTYKSQTVTTHALCGIDLDINTGELYMLVGPSGCGKTTLISIIAGILNPDSGKCIVSNQDLTKMSDRDKTSFRGKNIGFVFQAFNLIPTLTVTENVCVPLVISGVSRKEALNAAELMLHKVNLFEKRNSKPKELSGGQQQRVATARALIHNPKLIVCDEPTSALDQDTGNKIMELLKKITEDDKRTLIIVTHDSRIFHYGDKIARMNDGRIEEIIVQ